MKRRYLLLLGATPVVIFLVFIALALTKQTDFYGYHGWEAVEELADKYDLEIGTRNSFGPSHCSTAWRVFNEANKNGTLWNPRMKKKNLSVIDPESDELFKRVWSYLWLDCYSNQGWNPSKIR